ncbi:MAG: purine-nucleoside phosphorylase [Micrococcaceae bacterium]
MRNAKTPSSQLAEEAAQYIVENTGVKKHDIALVLGSGWSSAADLIGEEVASLDADDVPGFSKPAVVGHSAKIRSIKITHGKNAGKYALVLGSRTHFYEGKGVDAVAHGMRTAAATGCKLVILTNGCGTTNVSWKPGQAVLISDHINFTGATPLQGANFVDLTDLYSPRVRSIAQTIDPSLEEGIYIQFPGPDYETPAEVRMAKILGADLIGMSTTLEAIAARAEDMEVFGISLVTNLGAGLSQEALSHEEVLEAGRDASSRIGKLLAEIIAQS